MSFVYALNSLVAVVLAAVDHHRIGRSTSGGIVPESGDVGDRRISFACSVVAFFDSSSSGAKPHSKFRYIDFCNRVAWKLMSSLYVDQLSVLVLLLVTGVSYVVVHAYSSRYMIGDIKHTRFFAVMSLFTFAMILLVMSSNLMTMFIGWELMGICSYLLISHQSNRKAACDAATKAFLVNAVADVGLLFGIVLAYVYVWDARHSTDH